MSLTIPTRSIHSTLGHLLTGWRDCLSFLFSGYTNFFSLLSTTLTFIMRSILTRFSRPLWPRESLVQSCSIVSSTFMPIIFPAIHSVARGDWYDDSSKRWKSPALSSQMLWPSSTRRGGRRSREHGQGNSSYFTTRRRTWGV